MASENPLPALENATLNSLLHHLNRVEDLICDNVASDNVRQDSNLTVEDLDRYMTEKTCTVVRQEIERVQK